MVRIFRLSAGLGAAGLFAASAPAKAGLWQLPLGVSPGSRVMHELHGMLLWICGGIAVVVFGALFFALFRYRRGRGPAGGPVRSSDWRLEALWTAIPLALLVLVAVPSTRAVLLLDDDRDAALTIQATGYQWYWKYDYLDYEFGFVSTLATPWAAVEGRAPKGEHYLLEVDRPLKLPVGRKIRILTTSNDVIHAWWVPELGVKRDAIPGFVNEAWTLIERPGIYRGQCAELCGAKHGFMPIVVEAVGELEFRRWIEAQQEARRKELALADKLWSRDDLMARGELVYQANCAACHGPDGRGQPGAFPGLVGSAVVRGALAAHAEVVMYGRRDTAMQAYLRQLNDIDLAAVITFERNAWGNDRYDMLQPRQVRALRAEPPEARR